MGVSEPGISVVVPSFNRAHLVGATVDAILAQTLPPLEVLIIDDGSTDDTEAVCARFRPPVRYIKQANTGLSGARNRGIHEARGNWIALCDSDDVWHPRKLEIQMAALRAFPQVRWCLTGFELIDPDGRPVAAAAGPWTRVFEVLAATGRGPEEHLGRCLTRAELRLAGAAHVVFQGDAFQLFFEGNVALPSSALVARSLIQEIGSFDPALRVAEETEFFHRAAAASPLLVVMDALVQYRVGHASIVSSGDPTQLARNALVSLERAKSLRPHLSDAAWKAYHWGRRRLWLKLAYARLTLLDPDGARATLRQAWRSDHPRSPRFFALWLAALLPASALAWLHRAKRALVAGG